MRICLMLMFFTQRIPELLN